MTMDNVMTIGCTCAYLLRRAEKHRRAGRYDEAMALLKKARDQFGLHEDIEMETARVYEEMGCEGEAARAYLRVVRQGGEYKGAALFSLSLACAQRGDLNRSVSYFEQFIGGGQGKGVDMELATTLGQQLLEAIEEPLPRSRRAYARSLERKAAARLQEGKADAAKLLMEHAVRLHESARGYTLLACCHLFRHRLQEAKQAALRAYRLSPGRVQTLCVLSDIYAALGEETLSRRALHLAAMRTNVTNDDLFSVAMESAKHGDDRMTLRMTKRLLAREPYHTSGMRLRACALMNLGRKKEASRLFGRLCGLLPEDTVCAYYYRLSCEEAQQTERLALGTDVTREEGLRRAAELIAQLYISPEEIGADTAALRRIGGLCAWAFRSAMAGGHVKTVALILMTALSGYPEAQEVLLDALTDPQLPDGFKLHVLQALAGKEGFKPYFVDMGGRMLRLAAGGISEQPMRGSRVRSQAVQYACDALADRYPDAPKELMEMYLMYLKHYPQPRGQEERACAAAMEALYPRKDGKKADVRKIARRYRITSRLLNQFLRRFARCAKAEKQQE